MRKLILAAALFGAASLPAIAKPQETQLLTSATSVHSYILLDRTGSMSSIWDEALGSVNAYAESVAKPAEGEADTLKTMVNLAVFDAQDGLEFDILRRSVEAGAWTTVTSDEASPRGMTPLYDAIGRLVTLAETDAPEKAVLVIMTDGLENASREMTGDGAKAALDRARAKGWEVVFLGAEFANFSDADAVGVSGTRSIAVGSGNFGETMNRLARKSRDYAQEPAAVIEFDAEDRAASGEEEVKDRTGQ